MQDALTYTLDQMLQMLPFIFPKDCTGFRLMDVKTKSLKHIVDPCAAVSVGLRRLT